MQCHACLAAPTGISSQYPPIYRDAYTKLPFSYYLAHFVTIKVNNDCGLVNGAVATLSYKGVYWLTGRLPHCCRYMIVSSWFIRVSRNLGIYSLYVTLKRNWVNSSFLGCLRLDTTDILAIREVSFARIRSSWGIGREFLR